jgi:hypothetical protein
MASGRHKPGSRTRAQGYTAKSGWPRWNKPQQGIAVVLTVTLVRRLRKKTSVDALVGLTAGFRTPRRDTQEAGAYEDIALNHRVPDKATCAFKVWQDMG